MGTLRRVFAVIGLSTLVSTGLVAAADGVASVDPPLAITTTSLPYASYAVPYNVTVDATGGAAPYTFSVASGSLPPGLTLNADGTITGTPSGYVPYSYGVTVMVTDSGTPAQTDTQSLSIYVQQGPTALTVDPVLVQTSPLGVRFGVLGATLRYGSPLQPFPGQQVGFYSESIASGPLSNLFAILGSIEPIASTILGQLLYDLGTSLQSILYEPLCSATTDASGYATCSPQTSTMAHLLLTGRVVALYSGFGSWSSAGGAAGLA